MADRDTAAEQERQNLRLLMAKALSISEHAARSRLSHGSAGATTPCRARRTSKRRSEVVDVNEAFP